MIGDASLKAPINKTYQSSIKHLLIECGSLKNSEILCIVCDSSTKDIAQAFANEALLITPLTILIEIPLAKNHGEEPPNFAINDMLKADLIISLCQFSLAHSKVRIDAGKKGARFLSMPLYDWSLLNNPAVLIDFKKQAPIVQKITNCFSLGKKAHITTHAGTDVVLDISGRSGNYCPGFVELPGDLGSPPDIESNVSPVEDLSNGTVVVDGSITCPELGLLTSPVILTVKSGKIIRFDSQNTQYIDILNRMFDGVESKKRVLAECGVGLNPAATLTGSMLTDEGALGCMHFGFGSNYTVGGKNKVDFHLDFVFKHASLAVDGEQLLLNGELVI